MKLLIIGKNGQVGGALGRQAMARGIEAISLSHADLEITDEAAVRRAVADHRPTHIINTAAYNAVDQAEKEEARAMQVNGVAPGYFAKAARENNIRLIHYSTDYVFDGTAKADYTETDTPNPISAYGRSKRTGEQAVLDEAPEHGFIFRVAWVFAPGHSNFVSRLVSRAQESETLNFINDQWDTPTYAADIADATLAVIDRNAAPGIYHMVGSEACTPYEWARQTVMAAKLDVAIHPIPGDSFKTPAPRPKRSILANKKLTAMGIHMPSGIDQLGDYFRRMEANR